MEAEVLNVTLPADLAQIVRDHVAGGAFASDAEVVRAGLRLLLEREGELNALRSTLDVAANSDVWFTDVEVGQSIAEAVAKGQTSRV